MERIGPWPQALVVQSVQCHDNITIYYVSEEEAHDMIIRVIGFDDKLNYTHHWSRHPSWSDLASMSGNWSMESSQVNFIYPAVVPEPYMKSSPAPFM